MEVFWECRGLFYKKVLCIFILSTSLLEALLLLVKLEKALLDGALSLVKLCGADVVRCRITEKLLGDAFKLRAGKP